MKKVININFQGRVVPIEESAYDILKQYVESLRRFFANEEGRDEIINDIEDRIAELFTETLKKGSSCITDEEVNTIIASMGKPEDFEAEEASVKSQLGGNEGADANTSYHAATTDLPRGRLYRDSNDKILAGVCGGLANYLRIDSSIVRILFAVITFGGFGAGFLLYILMWIVLPSRSLEKSVVKKRLFRNPDDRIIAGVAGGLAAYFNINVWIPRFIFSIPLILGIISSIFRNMFGHFDDGFPIIFGSFGSTFFIVYVILWAVIPEANTASEKLEMRGEKVDLNTIKNTIQEDLKGFGTRAEKWGKDVGERAKQFGSEVGDIASQRTAEANATFRRSGSRFGNAIAVLFKAFFLFIAGVLAFALLMAVLGMLIGGVSIFPLKDFMLEGFTQNLLALATVILFIGVPIMGLVTWIIRRIMKIKSKSPYLGYAFGGLWTIGFICAVFLTASIYKSFRRPTSDKIPVNITQPTSDNMIVRLGEMKGKYYSFEFDDDHGDSDIMLSKHEDSMLIRNVGVQLAKSDDSAYHVYMIRYARGRDVQNAEETAQRIRFDISQKDSILELQKGFGISKDDKFRFQRIAIIIEVPVGKKIRMDRSLDWYDWFNVNFNDRGYRSNYDKTLYNWDYGKEYVMTATGGLEQVKPTRTEQGSERSRNEAEELKRERERHQKELDRINNELKKDSSYRYSPSASVDNDNRGEANNAKPQARLHQKPARPSYLGDLMMIRFGS